MLELPEVLTRSAQLREHVVGKRVEQVLPPSKPHKFCWYQGEPEAYDEMLRGCTVTAATGFGLFVELAFDNGCKFCWNDGANARLLPREKRPKHYQLAIAFTDGMDLVFTVAMYGGLILHDGVYDNEYYLKSKEAVSPFSGAFSGYYHKLLAHSKPNLSAKAFLATQQRFPGIGNGVLQDILFAAGIPPKRKIGTLGEAEKEKLLACTVEVLRDMTARGGRDTEKDLFGQAGGYPTRLSRNTLAYGCPQCGGRIVKEAYLGGAVYYCPVCQPME